MYIPSCVWCIPHWNLNGNAIIPCSLLVPAGFSTLSSTEQESPTLVRPLPLSSGMGLGPDLVPGASS